MGEKIDLGRNLEKVGEIGILGFFFMNSQEGGAYIQKLGEERESQGLPPVGGMCS